MIVIFIFGVVSAALWAGGWSRAAEQKEQMTAYAMVLGKIVSADTSWLDSGSYTLKVEYAYEWEGKKHVSRKLGPMEIAGDLTWAKGLLEEYKPGTTVKVYVNPKEASQAYLHKQTVFTPYLFVLGPMLAWLWLIWRLNEGGFFTGRPAAILIGPVDWFSISPSHHRFTGILAWLAVGIMWTGYAALAGLHYFSYAQSPKHYAAITTLAIYGLIGIWILGKQAVHAIAAVQLPDPKIDATLGQFRMHKPIIVRAEQKFITEMDVRNVRLVLSCFVRSGFSSRRIFAETAIMTERRRMAEGEILKIEHSFAVGRQEKGMEQCFSRWAYPRYDWQLELIVEPVKGAASSVVFPIEIQPDETAVMAEAA